MRNTKMKNYTIGYINHDALVHSRYLGPSLAALQGQFDILSTTSLKCPASNYNDMIDRCTTPYLILTHQDVSFPPDLLACVDNTIAQVPEFGALGMVGVDDIGQYRSSNLSHITRLLTMDCCFIVLRKDLEVRFDDKIFDGLHQYVEDYCGQLAYGKKRQCYTILARNGHTITPEHTHPGPAQGYWYHHGYTYSRRGGCWGNWPEYHRLLLTKWPNIRTT